MVTVLKLGPNSVGGENTSFTIINSATDKLLATSVDNRLHCTLLFKVLWADCSIICHRCNLTEKEKLGSIKSWLKAYDVVFQVSKRCPLDVQQSSQI